MIYSPLDVQEIFYIIVFDDTDKPMLVFTDKDAAIKTWEFYNVNWNCHLLSSLEKE